MESMETGYPIRAIESSRCNCTIPVPAARVAGGREDWAESSSAVRRGIHHQCRAECGGAEEWRWRGFRGGVRASRQQGTDAIPSLVANVLWLGLVIEPAWMSGYRRRHRAASRSAIRGELRWRVAASSSLILKAMHARTVRTIHSLCICS